MRKIVFDRAVLFCGCCVASLMAASPAAAQSAPAASPAATDEGDQASGARLEDIIVTAQRIETNLQTTPISVTAISADVLEQRGSTNLLDLANYTPSLSIASNSAGGGTGNGASVAIRGMGVGAPDSSAAVGVYVDSVYQPSIFGNMLGLLDIQRVEVLRGPQGTLFGRNTLAGAIQYVSNKPGQKLEGNIEGTLGTYERKAIRGAVNLPLGPTLALRLSGSYDNQGGYVTDDFNGIKRGQVRSTLGRAQLRWTPTDTLTVDLKAEFARRRENGRPVAIIGANPNALFGGLAFLNGEMRPISDDYVSTRKYHFAGYNAPDYFNSDLRTYQGTIEYQLSDSVTFKSISAYVDNKSYGATDFDMTPLALFEAFRGNYNDKVFSQEFQLIGTALEDRLHFTLGTYYFSGNLSLLNQTFYIGQPNAVLMNPDGSTRINTATANDNVENKVRSISGYGQLTYDLTDSLSLVGGLRYTREKVTGIDLSLDLQSKATFTDFSPRFGINLKASDDVFLYASAAKGFRAGGFTINSFFLQPIDPNEPKVVAQAFKPETQWTYEIGARIELFDKRLRINPTLFYTDWKNIQFQRDIPTLGGNIVAATRNAGDARIKGAELEVQATPVDGLLLTGSAAYLDSRYTRIENFTLTTYPQGFLAFLFGMDPDTGMPAPGTLAVVPNLSLSSPLQQSPKFKYTLGARYTYTMADGATIIPSIDFAHTSGFRIGVTDGSSQPLPGYGVVNGRIQFNTATPNNFSFSIYATNLFNKYYLVGGNGLGKGYTIGFDEADPARPREVGATVSMRF